MKVSISTKLSCSANAAWEKVQTPALLLYVMKPLASAKSTDPEGFPKTWESGQTYHCKIYLFCFIPMGTRTLQIEKIDSAHFEIQSREKDPLIQKWDHLIKIWSESGKTYYRDDIEIDAGIFTFFVWAWANWFYRHRQRRWRKLTKELYYESKTENYNT